MGKEKHRDEEENDEKSRPKPKSKSKSKSKSKYSDSEDEKASNRKNTSRRRSRSRRSRYSESEYSSSDSDERRKRRKREEKETEKRRRKDKDKKKKKKRRRDFDSHDQKKKKNKERRSNKKKSKEDKGKTGAVTDLWGKFGIIRETDMWNKRPEFTAWLAEVKKINLESLPNYEEKQMFKEFMEDHNTATFPSKKYYNLDAYYKHKIEKEMKKGLKKVPHTERTIFDDEEQRRQELLREREKQKEQEVEALKRSMQNGLAQAMKDQAQLREEMAYQFKIGNSEAAAAIQRRLDPDLPM
ncbi:hypothetical protein LIER_30769 [Lithospermum erythrorhizon]|uniref:Nucleic acid binding protein n=1 Tax=Lithospermum erythrorhizon TaxID=34254 RepID=A0AAV3RQT3_LITER